MTKKLIKSKKHIFRTPRKTKKIKYLLPRIFSAKMYLLHFVITPHFRAACQFSSDSSGPVLRTWIFFMSFLYIFEKKNRNFWNFKNVIKIVISDEILHFRCLNPLIRLRQTRFWHKISLFRNFTKFQIFYPTGVVLKPIFFEIFSKLKKDIDKQSFPADHPLCASPTRPWWLWHQNDSKNSKVQKTHFQSPPPNKKN